MSVEKKFEELKNRIKALEKVVIAYSAGVDSTFLLKVAHDILKDNLIAVTVKLNSVPQRELDEAVSFCKDLSVRHTVIDINEFDIQGFSENPKNRCYICKKTVFSKIWDFAEKNDIKYVIEGSNTDDSKDYRPGSQAVKELNVKSPLSEAGLTKDEIRILSKRLKLPTWNKPSFACLASRFVYGEEITKEKLMMVEKSEQFLSDLNFTQFRVRVHGNMARIEVYPEEFDKIFENKTKIYEKLTSLGFSYVTLDLGGYKTGSMNIPLIQ